MELPRVTARELLGTTASVLAARASSLLFLALAATLPGTVLMSFARVGASRHGFDPAVSAAMLVHFGCVCFAQAGIARVVIEHLAGRRPPDAIEALGAASGRIVPITLSVILATLLTSLGLLVLVVPGILAWLAFFVVVPVALSEGLGPIAALQRSAVLTRGRRSVLFVSAAAVAAAYAAYGCCFSGVTLVTWEETGPTPTMRFLYVALHLIGQAFLIATLSTLATVFFARVKAIRARLDLDRIVDELG